MKSKNVIKLIFIIVFLVCSRFMYHKYNDAYGTVYGTVIDKTETLGAYSLWIHPNDNRLKDFEVKCPSSVYAKYNIGDKVVFRNVNIYDKLKEQKWYDEPNLCAIISICLFYAAFLFTFVLILCLIFLC